MRPSMTEQLEALRRILQEVVAPEVSGAYAADILAGVCATLDTLAAGWHQIPGFLRWDAEQSAAVLKEVLAAQPNLDPRLAEVVEAAVAAPRPDPADVAALEVHHRLLRGALERAAPLILTDPGLRAARTRFMDLVRERAGRYPLSSAWRPAGSAPSAPAR